MTLQEALEHGITALMRQHRETVVSQDLSDYAKATAAEVYIHAIARLSTLQHAVRETSMEPEL